MEKALDNLRVLIIDDEPLIAMDIASVVVEAGYEVVGMAGTVRRALGLIDRGPSCDVAVLDANLNGESAEPIAAALRQRGAPFVVVSGYTGRQLPGVLTEAPFMAKPYSAERLVELLSRLASRARQ
jgi:DNA-binding LytR/AlgR family response regulator